MTQLRKSRSVKASKKGLELLKNAKAEKAMSYAQIADQSDKDGRPDCAMTDKTVMRFFYGAGLDPKNAVEIARILGLKWQDICGVEEVLTSEVIAQVELVGTKDSQRAAGLIGELEKALDELKQGEEGSLLIMEWLEANRKGLSQDAAEDVLRNHADQENPNSETFVNDVERFAKDIRKYLQLLYFCLEDGSWKLMEIAIEESILPVNWDLDFYSEALTFIKNEKINPIFSPESSQEVILLIDYLIALIPVRL